MKPVGAAELHASERGQTGVGNQHNDAHADQAAGELTEPVGQPFEAAIEAREEPCDGPCQQEAMRDGAVGLMRQQQYGTERGAERQRDEAGDDRRGGDRNRELAEELARDPRDEGGGDEYRAERQRDGDERAADLVHGPPGGS